MKTIFPLDGLAAGLLLLLCTSAEAPERSERPDHRAGTTQSPGTVVMDPANQPQQCDSLYAYPEYTDGELKYGFMNRNGEVVIQPKFDLAGDFYHDFAAVVEGDRHGFIDPSGNIVWLLKDCRFSIGHWDPSGEDFFYGHGEGRYLVVDENNKYGYVDYYGNPIIPCTWDGGERFSCERAVVYKDGKAGFINSLGHIVIPPRYEKAWSFSENLAAVSINGKTGFIDQRGKLVIPAVYEEAYAFNEGLCPVLKLPDYTYYYIDPKGNTAIEGPFEQAGDFKDGEALVLKDGECIIINNNGKKLRTGGENCFGGC